MPESIVSAGALSKASVAWFGKLPSQGDFVGRRMPHATLTCWDDWMRAGMESLRNEASTNWENRFVRSPLWFFMSPAVFMGLPAVGVLAPSVDRVGRYYPISVMALADQANADFASDAAVSRFLTGARDAVVNARRLPLSADQLDAQLAHLCSPFASPTPAPGAALIDALLADLQGAEMAPMGSTAELPNLDWRVMQRQAPQATVWWISPTPLFPRDELIHHGPLGRPLFTRLFKGQCR